MTVSISFAQSETKLFGNDWCDNWLSGANWTCLYNRLHPVTPHPSPPPPPSTFVSCPPWGCKLTRVCSRERRLLAELHVVCSRTVFSSSLRDSRRDKLPPRRRARERRRLNASRYSASLARCSLRVVCSVKKMWQNFLRKFFFFYSELERDEKKHLNFNQLKIICSF